LNWIEVAVLIFSGLAVGFINTLAGGGSVISLSVLMLMGLPAPVANGTNRIAVTIQTLTAATVFRRQKVLDLKKGTILGIPRRLDRCSAPGSPSTSTKLFLKKLLQSSCWLCWFSSSIIPTNTFTEKQDLVDKKVTPLQWLIFFVLGIYGGFVHVGIGYFLLAALVLNAGYDLVRANAVKVLIVLMYMPFSFLIFLWMSDINWAYGLVMMIGSVVGAFIASHLAVKKGSSL